MLCLSPTLVLALPPTIIERVQHRLTGAMTIES
jgi:hypothetical protein